MGWKITGTPPLHIPKCVMIAVPHTSNWDFPLGLLVRSATRLKANFVGKKSLFMWPFGYIFRALGGIPVDRTKNTNFVDAVIDIYRHRSHFQMTIAPEGTRKKTDKLKTGFYYIALGAKVPIVKVKFDYTNKLVDFASPYYPTGDKEQDFKHIDDYFRGVSGKIKANSYGI